MMLITVTSLKIKILYISTYFINLAPNILLGTVIGKKIREITPVALHIISSLSQISYDLTLLFISHDIILVPA